MKVHLEGDFTGVVVAIIGSVQVDRNRLVAEPVHILWEGRGRRREALLSTRTVFTSHQETAVAISSDPQIFVTSQASIHCLSTIRANDPIMVEFRKSKLSNLD